MKKAKRATATPREIMMADMIQRSIKPDASTSSSAKAARAKMIRRGLKIGRREVAICHLWRGAKRIVGKLPTQVGIAFATP